MRRTQQGPGTLVLLTASAIIALAACTTSTIAAPLAPTRTAAPTDPFVPPSTTQPVVPPTTLTPPPATQAPKPPRTPKPKRTRPFEACPSNPLRGVYHPDRLWVLGTCRWYVGTVARVIHEQDGDYHVDVAPSYGYRRFLDADNYSAQYGELVTEIMPGQRFPAPFVGERIALFGTWSYDSDHGWNEIHPIWAISYLDSGTTFASLPVVPPRYQPDEGGSGGGGGGGGSCDPSYTNVCLKDGIGDYDCSGGSGDGPNYTPPGVVVRVVGADPFRLDGNHDGYACG